MRLDHPNIAVVYEIGSTAPSPRHPEGRLFLATGYGAGGTLAQRIARGPLPLAVTLDLALQLFDGLSRAHEAGIVHRDVKPANLLLSEDGVLKIIDFGIAQRRDARPGGRDSDDQAPRMGTVASMSPEQVRGDPLDPRTDLWSAGVVLYEMLSGRHPFRGPDATETLRRILEEEAAPLESLRPEVPSRLVRVVARCLRKRPQDRPPSAAAC